MTDAALRFLERDPLLCCGLLHVIRRGSAHVLFADGHGVLLQDRLSGMHMLAGPCSETTLGWLDSLDTAPGCLLLTDGRLAGCARRRFGLERCQDYWQFVYEKDAPPESSGVLSAAPPTEAEMAVIRRVYTTLSPEELETVRRSGNLFAAHDGTGAMVGFIGEHMEGCMGLLEVLPEYRGCGYATALESALIARVLTRGQRPFCQVAPDNAASLGLQRKLGLTRAEGKVYFVY